MDSISNFQFARRAGILGLAIIFSGIAHTLAYAQNVLPAAAANGKTPPHTFSDKSLTATTTVATESIECGTPLLAASDDETKAPSAGDIPPPTKLPELARQPDRELHILGNQILKKEIQLEKFNILFNRESNVQGRWKGLRYFLSQETNCALTLSGLIWLIDVRERSLLHPIRTQRNGTTIVTLRRINRAALEHAVILQIVGQQIATAGSAFELAVNLYHANKAKKIGCDDKTALRRAADAKTEIARLLAQRQQLVDNTSAAPAHKKVLRLEGEVLQDICNLSFDEFRNFRVANRRSRAFQNSLYILDMAKNTTGWIANIITLEAIERRKHKLGGAGAVMVTVSGALVTSAPILSRGVGKLAEICDRHYLNTLYGETNKSDLSKLVEDHRQLKLALSLDKNNDSGSLADYQNRLSIYEEQSASRTHLADSTRRQIMAGQRAATENVLAGQIVGDTKMATGITGMIANYLHPRTPRASSPLIADGQITYLAGTGMALVDNIRIQAQAEIRRRHLAQRRLLPGLIYADRLSRLNELEKRMDMQPDLPIQQDKLPVNRAAPTR